ncbi:MAG: cysteine hydrolase family protein [Arenicellales bacterium]|nr:cysteine hydrolase family protein [Arenicellales bacterium]
MNQALILVDIQNDYFPGGNMELVGMEVAADKASQLLKLFRQKQLDVFHIQHLSVQPGSTFFIPDTEGVKTHPIVAPQSDEPVIQKNFPNSFRETKLLQSLQQKEIDELVICGAMSHMCIDATTRAAFDFGFNCIVVQDACATRDLTFEGETVKSFDVHAAFMAALAMPYAKVMDAQQLLAAKY